MESIPADSGRGRVHLDKSQFITALTHRDKHAFTLTFTPTDSLCGLWEEAGEPRENSHHSTDVLVGKLNSHWCMNIVGEWSGLVEHLIHLCWTHTHTRARAPSLTCHQQWPASQSSCCSCYQSLPPRSLQLLTYDRITQPTMWGERCRWMPGNQIHASEGHLQQFTTHTHIFCSLTSYFYLMSKPGIIFGCSVLEHLSTSERVSSSQQFSAPTLTNIYS